MTNMLSRIADSLFWLNRYMERTDSLVRLMSIHYILSLDKGLNAPQSWRPVLQISTYLNSDEIEKIEHDMPAVLHKIIFDTHNPNSLKVIVQSTRKCPGRTRPYYKRNMGRSKPDLSLHQSAASH